MSALLLSDEQRDGLQEIINISMGQAANNLALLIGKHIQLSIPSIVQLTSQEFGRYLDASADYSITRQPFLGALNGEVLALLHRLGSSELAGQLNFPAEMNQTEQEELYLELSNILAGACIQGLIQQLGLKLHLAAPTLLNAEQINTLHLNWQQALLMEVSFSVAQTSFSSTVLICLQQNSLSQLKIHLNQLLE